MKAIMVNSYGAPEVMRIEEVADPVPGEGQVLVKLYAVGVNPVDTYIRSGSYGNVAVPPYTPGIDGAGVIEAVGPGVKHRKVGQRVYVAWCLTGTYAEKTLCKEFQTHPLPEGLSFSQGAAVGVPYATGYRALFQKAHAQPGEQVLIHGASGGVGIAAVQLGRAAGLRVIGTAGSEQGRRLVLEMGAHQAIDHHQPDHMEKAKELTCGQGLDVIIEMLANQNLAMDLQALAKGGRVVVVGNRGTIEIDPRATMSQDSMVIGMALFNASEQDLATIHAALGAGLENGTLRPVVSKELPLAEAATAHHEVIESSTFGKIVLLP
ncbi:NADPH:quinone reductase [Geomonas sp.]|uniref:NADPH:quinone reductase n=1 Tax=Geomonas sp. TaxID=2651584 RepID=UPI002B47B31E|nr:NADPH:quinone reductase [Geomonas sp.]HJV34904.1 NADPH:quinone reductase [Geomonas sp.]